VRFADPRVVFIAAQRAVREALSQATRVAPVVRDDRVQEATEAYLARPASRPQAGLSLSRVTSQPSTTEADSLFSVAAPTVLGQHRNTYIVATDGEDLLLVDQHTAHERVRFEALLARAAAHGPESQLLLSPLVMELEPRLRPGLDTYESELRGLGFDVEPFGGGAVRLRAVPPLLAGRDAGRALAAVLRDLLERDAADWVVARSDERLAATIACHSAVRGGQPLQRETMAAIVRDLASTAHPTLCPHGRPTIVRIPRDDLSRWFGRSGWKRQ